MKAVLLLMHKFLDSSNSLKLFWTYLRFAETVQNSLVIPYKSFRFNNSSSWHDDNTLFRTFTAMWDSFKTVKDSLKPTRTFQYSFKSLIPVEDFLRFFIWNLLTVQDSVKTSDDSSILGQGWKFLVYRLKQID